MKIFIILSFFLMFVLNSSVGELIVKQIVMRIPREHDYGLIFDLAVSNNGKENLYYQVRPDGVCTLLLSSNEKMCGAGKIVGGDFGLIKPQETDISSLIWPTTSLFNRLGQCPIQIIYSNDKKDEKSIKQTVHIDSRFGTLDPEEKTFRKYSHYKDCKNFDKDYLKDCKVVDCEERYFGRRNFYNKTSEHCEPVPRCSNTHEFYNSFTNECVDLQNIITEKEIQYLKAGKYMSNLEMDQQSGEKKFDGGMMTIGKQNKRRKFKRSYSQKSFEASDGCGEQDSSQFNQDSSDSNNCTCDDCDLLLINDTKDEYNEVFDAISLLNKTIDENVPEKVSVEYVNDNFDKSGSKPFDDKSAGSETFEDEIDTKETLKEHYPNEYDPPKFRLFKGLPKEDLPNKLSQSKIQCNEEYPKEDLCNEDCSKKGLPKDEQPKETQSECPKKSPPPVESPKEQWDDVRSNEDQLKGTCTSEPPPKKMKRPQKPPHPPKPKEDNCDCQVAKIGHGDGSESEFEYWIRGLINGFIIVVATIAIYICICFFIYSIASWWSEGRDNTYSARTNCIRGQPNSTPSIIMSQR